MTGAPTGRCQEGPKGAEGTGREDGDTQGGRRGAKGAPTGDTGLPRGEPRGGKVLGVWGGDGGTQRGHWGAKGASKGAWGTQRGGRGHPKRIWGARGQPLEMGCTPWGEGSAEEPPIADGGGGKQAQNGGGAPSGGQRVGRARGHPQKPGEDIGVQSRAPRAAGCREGPYRGFGGARGGTG